MHTLSELLRMADDDGFVSIQAPNMKRYHERDGLKGSKAELQTLWSLFTDMPFLVRNMDVAKQDKPLGTTQKRVLKESQLTIKEVSERTIEAKVNIHALCMLPGIQPKMVEMESLANLFENLATAQKTIPSLQCVVQFVRNEKVKGNIYISKSEVRDFDTEEHFKANTDPRMDKFVSILAELNKNVIEDPILNAWGQRIRKELTQIGVHSWWGIQERYLFKNGDSPQSQFIYKRIEDERKLNELTLGM